MGDDASTEGQLLAMASESRRGEGHLRLHDAAASADLGQYDDHVRPEGLELALHEDACALADRDHRGDGGNADHHAQHGESGSHLVLAERRRAIRTVIGEIISSWPEQWGSRRGPGSEFPSPRRRRAAGSP